MINYYVEIYVQVTDRTATFDYVREFDLSGSYYGDLYNLSLGCNDTDFETLEKLLREFPFDVYDENGNKLNEVIIVKYYDEEYIDDIVVSLAS